MDGWMDALNQHDKTASGEEEKQRTEAAQSLSEMQGTVFRGSQMGNLGDILSDLMMVSHTSKE